jgi:hypothetical protein
MIPHFEAGSPNPPNLDSPSYFHLVSGLALAHVTLNRKATMMESGYRHMSSGSLNIPPPSSTNANGPPPSSAGGVARFNEGARSPPGRQSKSYVPL